MILLTLSLLPTYLSRPAHAWPFFCRPVHACRRSLLQQLPSGVVDATAAPYQGFPWGAKCNASLSAAPARLAFLGVSDPDGGGARSLRFAVTLDGAVAGQVPATGCSSAGARKLEWNIGE